MPVELYYVLALLVVAVIFGYFYLKRAQARTPSANTDDAAPATPAEAPGQDTPERPA